MPHCPIHGYYVVKCRECLRAWLDRKPGPETDENGHSESNVGPGSTEMDVALPLDGVSPPEPNTARRRGLARCLDWCLAV